jgi:hypothetical protein
MVTGLSFVECNLEETAAATATTTTTAATFTAAVLAAPDSPHNDSPRAIAPAPAAALTPEAHNVAALCDAAIAI